MSYLRRHMGCSLTAKVLMSVINVRMSRGPDVPAVHPLSITIIFTHTHTLVGASGWLVRSFIKYTLTGRRSEFRSVLFGL